jgi:hypothetical protein
MIIKMVINYILIKDPAIYMLTDSWMKKWQQYLYNTKMQMKRNFILGLPPPGKILNN